MRQHDIYVNYFKFKQNKENCLLIFGRSGSGTSTLGKYISEKYNCHYVDTDAFRQQAYWNTSELKDKFPLIFQYFNEKMLNFSRLDTPKLEPDVYQYEIDKFLKWCIEEQSEKVVIEGLQLNRYITSQFHWSILDDIPFIVKETSFFKSFYRRYFVRKDPFFFKFFFKILQKYRQTTGELNFIKQLIANNNLTYELIEEGCTYYL